MLKKVAALLAVAVCFGLPASAQTVDEIIAKSIQARGGEAKLRAVKTMRLSGKMELGPGMEAPMVMLAMRPSMVRQEFTIQGVTGIQAFDGTTGWTVMPFQSGKKDPEAMAADDLKEMQNQSDFDGPLMDYKAKGNTVEYLGKEKVEGSDAYKLKVTRKNGTEETSFIDVDSGLEVKTIAKTMMRGNETEVVVTMSDFRDVQGLVLPFSIEQGATGSPQKLRITIEKVEVNPQLDATQFHMPTAAPADAAKPADKPGVGLR